MVKNCVEFCIQSCTLPFGTLLMQIKPARTAIGVAVLRRISALNHSAHYAIANALYKTQ
ncbi:hypothetical protein [Methylomonas albis]|nr:hypothetical protein [Methylomonas albis]